MKKKYFKIKIKLPKNAFFTGQVGDSLKNYPIYEINRKEVIEKVFFDDIRKIKFCVKDGQYVRRNTVIFTTGFLGYKAFITRFSGVVDIGENYYQLIGEKKSYQRKINLSGFVYKVKQPDFVIIKIKAYEIRPLFYFNKKNLISHKVVSSNVKTIICDEKFSFFKLIDSTCFINENITLSDLRQLTSIGVKRLIVNGIFIDDLVDFANLLTKLDGLCVMSGFGELTSKRFNLVEDKGFNVFWGHERILICDEICDEINKNKKNVIYEHPLWGVSGKVVYMDNLTAFINNKGELFEVYRKNLD